ncbi:hypothetical protein [Klebsiella michiganensis]|uniref:hypothetical protein n=1 Tax=Klebsiella michiganensis TaxID=1134687 RepID=UPI0012B8F5B4|nr:hypothetical protein [Klebsiella michiganensis]MBE0114577.1 hypothetical protein [Klebsiella michiganensis]
MTDITKLAQSLKRRATSANEFGESLYVKGDDVLALVEALEKAQETIAFQQGEIKALLSSLESRTVKLPEPTNNKFWRNDWDATHFMYAAYVEDLKVELSAAGIKWEAE